MFFRISHNGEKNTFPFSQSRTIGKFTVSLDAGWHSNGDVLYKGYCLGKPLKQKVIDKDYSEQTGNYIILDFADVVCSIQHDDSRSFPVFYDKDTVTNLEDDSLTAVWFDGSVYYENGQWHFRHRQENVVKHTDQINNIDKKQLTDLWCSHLTESCEKLPTDLPIFCANSNGVDSLAVKSALDYCGKEYKLVDMSQSTKAHLGWGYRQLFETNTPHIQATGFCGDELLLRNPLYCQWLLDSANVNLVTEFDKTEHSYMKGFFNKRYREKVSAEVGRFPDIVHGYEHTANVSLNDYQMWHTDETITFTPFRNHGMALKGLRADCDTILYQVIHAGISKDIIRHLNPNNLDLMSKHKNNVT